MRIVLSANTGWYLWNFRSGLIRELSKQGHEVILIALRDKFLDQLEAEGYGVIPLHISGKGTRIWTEIRTLFGYFYYLRKLNPSVYFSFTIKPVLYGGLAAKFTRVPSIVTITGLGTVFIEESRLTSVVQLFYRWVLGGAYKVFFQNTADLELFLEKGMLQRGKASKVPGSGVNLDHFRFVTPPLHTTENGVKFLTLARLLRDKGIYELIAAAELVKKNFPNTEFWLAGPAGAENPTAISQQEVEQWDQQGKVRYLGPVDDVISLIAKADCVVLPSYREGMSRTLLEAGAIGRPIITTSVPGCSDVVVNNVTGLLCRPRSGQDLAKKIEEFIGLDLRQREKMGRAGRAKVQREFSEKRVLDMYFDVIEDLKVRRI